jgi:lipoprotein-releasing system permease protein
MYRWVIAWRWLKSLPMLWVSVVGVFLGVASILVVDSIFNGVLAELRDVYKGTAADLYVPMVLPRRAGELQLPTDRILDEIRGCEGVAGATARLVWPCLLPEGLRLPDIVAIGSISRRSLLDVRGIEPDGEASATQFRRYLEAAAPERRVRDLARPFDVSDLPGADPSAIPLLLGERAAHELGLERGATFELMTFPDGVSVAQAKQKGIEPRVARFLLAGTFDTGFYLEDMTRALVPLRELERFVGTARTSTEIVVKLAEGAPLEEVRERLIAKLGGPPFNLSQWFTTPVTTWEKLNENVLAAIENQRQVLDLILFFVVIVAGFNLLVSLNLIVTEKLRDVGTLASLGASSLGIASVFTALGFLVTLVGSALGLAGGAFFAHHVNGLHEWFARLTGHRLWEPTTYLFDTIPTVVAPGVIGLGIAATFAVTLLFAFIASLRAARLDPVVALRHE